MSRVAFAYALVTAVVASGCAEAVVRNGLPAGMVADGYDGRWHDSFLFGTFEPSPLRDVARICPLGWSELRATVSFPAGVVHLFTLGIYTPQVVTVVCAAPPGVYVGAPGETPLLPACPDTH